MPESVMHHPIKWTIMTLIIGNPFASRMFSCLFLFCTNIVQYVSKNHDYKINQEYFSAKRHMLSCQFINRHSFTSLSPHSKPSMLLKNEVAVSNIEFCVMPPSTLTYFNSFEASMTISRLSPSSCVVPIT